VRIGESDETIGGLIALVRAENGITQLRLAAGLCASAGVATVTRHEVSRWEREERIPSGYWLAWLALALDVPLEQLERAAAAARRRRLPGRDRHWRELSAGVYQREAS
jgi:transcriptional regulator with XRE-family HTH domain